MTWQSIIDDIVTDNLSGATAIAFNAARAIGAMCREEPFESQESLLDVMRSMAGRLVTNQAGMAPLVTLLNRVFFAASGAPDTVTALEASVDAAEAFVAEVEEARRESVRRATNLIPNRITILTHTYSSTVAMLLTQAAQAGRGTRVICLEARPMCEGQRMAVELAEAGLDVTLTIDAAAHDMLRACDLVVVGADNLNETGAMSKIGTAGIAVSAKSLGVPIYVVADSTKIWPASLGAPPISDHSAAEVWEDAPATVRVLNRYFDTTPWQAVSGVVTEQGLLTPDEVCTASRQKPVHRYLQTIVAEVHRHT